MASCSISDSRSLLVSVGSTNQSMARRTLVSITANLHLEGEACDRTGRVTAYSR